MTSPEIDGLLRPLSARSLIASALLGSHPPRMPGRLLVAMAERFGITGGAARVALSRMVERGELVNDRGTYTLTGSLLERQERQDRGRVGPEHWDGTWEQAVVTTTGRSAGDRSRLRKHLNDLGLGEYREGVWMRPTNLDPRRQPSARQAAARSVAWFDVAAMEPERAVALASELFELDEWARVATALCDAIGETRGRLGRDENAVVTGFNLASAALRHLARDPQLPAELLGPEWPAGNLRSAYAEFEGAYQALLREFFVSVG